MKVMITLIMRTLIIWTEEHFDLDSDADYLEFREIMKQEWAEKLSKD
jgi:hypothetical protein